MAQPECKICDGLLWVCENHPDEPWDKEAGCMCGAGMPCECNPGDRENPPKPLPGSVVVWTVEDGWAN